MINTGLLKIIILCFKILYYHSNIPEVDIEVITQGTYQMTIHYVEKEGVLHVSAVMGDRTQDIMEVKTIDNALYRVSLGGEESFTLDLAPYFVSIDWDKLGKKDMDVLNEDGDEILILLRTGKFNLYVTSPEAEGQTFVIPLTYFSR